MKNVCIVGYGAIGPIHAEAIKKTDHARFYAVCDCVPEKTEKCRIKYDVLTYTDFDEMLLDNNIDTIHICTPHYLHLSMIKKAIAAGKQVVCEKPITMSKKEFDELVELEGCDKICVSMQNRFNPCGLKLKQLVDSGKLGKIIAGRGIVTWRRTAEYYAQDEWRGKWETEGGGVLINQAVHTLDLLCYVCGKTAAVKVDMMNFSLPEIDVEDTCCGILQFESGAKGMFFASNAHGGNSPIDIELMFEKGIVRCVDSKLYINGEVVEQDEVPECGKKYWGIGHEALCKNYYDCNFYFNPFDVKNTMETVFAMYESAKQNGKEIRL